MLANGGLVQITGSRMNRGDASVQGFGLIDKPAGWAQDVNSC